MKTSKDLRLPAPIASHAKHRHKMKKGSAEKSANPSKFFGSPTWTQTRDLRINSQTKQLQGYLRLPYFTRDAVASD